MPEGDVNPEGQAGTGCKDQLDAAMQRREAGQTGNAVAGAAGDAGGDGATGYVFTDPHELGALVQRWQVEGDSIRHDADRFQRAAGGMSGPTPDPVTTGYFSALGSVLDEFLQHNHQLYQYNGEYVEKLAASREAYSQVDQANARQFPNGTR
jgi:hypothetical protein